MEENELEMAERLAQQQRDAKIAEVRESVLPEYHEDFDGKNCVDCGNGVGALRLKMGRIRCVECQTVREKRRAMGLPVEPDQVRPRPRVVLPELQAKDGAVE